MLKFPFLLYKSPEKSFNELDSAIEHLEHHNTLDYWFYMTERQRSAMVSFIQSEMNTPLSPGGNFAIFFVTLKRHANMYLTFIYLNIFIIIINCLFLYLFISTPIDIMTISLAWEEPMDISQPSHNEVLAYLLQVTNKKVGLPFIGLNILIHFLNLICFIQLFFD